MLMDALCVQVADDEGGNAQLMFSILDCLPTVNQVMPWLHARNKIISKLFQSIIAAREYFPTRSVSLK